MRWTDPKTWGGVVPPEGASVVIPANRQIVLDTSVRLSSLQIAGTLTFDSGADIELRAGSIQVAGSGAKLIAGSASAPHVGRATVTLTGRRPEGELAMARCDLKALCVLSGGTLQLYGAPRLSWTRLAATAQVGATQVQLIEVPRGWTPGDQVVLAATGVDHSNAEVRTIVAVDGNRVTIDQPLRHSHFGERQIVDGVMVETRGEVGLLTRNVVIRGDEQSDDDRFGGFGGHVMVMATGKMFLSSVQTHRMGQASVLGGYPLHWHLVGDANGQFISDSAVFESYNRCIVVHGTNSTWLARNVAVNTIGHCFFLEDGNERNNTLIGNLGMGVRAAAAGREVLKEVTWPGSVSSDRLPAVFWIGHPTNKVTNNVAAGSGGFGFWLSFRESPTGAGSSDKGAIFPRKDPWGDFSGNSAHSNFALDASLTDYNLGGSGFLMQAYDGAHAVVSDFTAYNNNSNGIWAHSAQLIGMKLLDQRIAVQSDVPYRIENSLLVGRSANDRLDEGATLPVLGVGIGDRRYGTFAIQYNGLGTFKNVTFANYGNARLSDTAIGVIFDQFNGVLIDLSGARFLDVARKLYFHGKARAGAAAATRERAVIVDPEGAVFGRAAWAVHDNSQVPPPAGCIYVDTWNAVVCDGK